MDLRFLLNLNVNINANTKVRNIQFDIFLSIKGYRLYLNFFPGQKFWLKLEYLQLNLTKSLNLVLGLNVKNDKP